MRSDDRQKQVVATDVREKEEDVVTLARRLRLEYAWNPDVMNDEDERVAAVKMILEKKLGVVDRTIILLYAEYGSLRKLGALLGVSATTAGKEIRRIRKLILEEYERVR